jgi:glycosyltransferase involved in cell wall biosynthesis
MLSRNDVFDVPGGDTIQMQQTKICLEKLGIEIYLDTIHNNLRLSNYDLIHIFNWEELVPFLAIYGLEPNRYPPLVLSTIFWLHTGHWFNHAVETKRVWKTITKGLSFSRSRKLYEDWQLVKFRWGAQGSRLRRSISIPARLLPNSITEINHLESVLGLNGKIRSRCSVIPNGVVKELYDPLPIPNQEFLRKYGIKEFVIQVARIQAAKNQLGLIQALYNLSVPIVFIGQASPYEPEYVQSCYELAQKRGNVYFLGSMSAKELAGIYVLAATHVLPSWRETPGLVSLEAAAAGCRIVSTSIGSAKEYFGDEAWYCDPRDQNSIRQAVINALESPPSHSLRERVLEQYTWDVAAKITLNTYCQVLENKTRENSLGYSNRD